MERARTRYTLVVAGCAGLIAGASTLATRFDSRAEGVTATVFADANWASAPVRSVIQEQPSTETLHEVWTGPPPATFSVTWTGSILIPVGGHYTFATKSDDGSW